MKRIQVIIKNIETSGVSFKFLRYIVFEIYGIRKLDNCGNVLNFVRLNKIPYPNARYMISKIWHFIRLNRFCLNLSTAWHTSTQHDTPQHDTSLHTRTHLSTPWLTLAHYDSHWHTCRSSCMASSAGRLCTSVPRKPLRCIPTNYKTTLLLGCEKGENNNKKN